MVIPLPERANVKVLFEQSRIKALQELDAARADTDTPEYAHALEAVRAARRGVAQGLGLTGGAAVPTQRADW